MSAIAISANLNNTNANLIYKAQHDALVLCDRVISPTPNATVSYTKKLPTGISIPLSDLQGVFFGKGTELLAQSSANCQLEITLMSRAAEEDYQVIYPASQVDVFLNRANIDPACGSCSAGKQPTFVIGSNPGNQINFLFQVIGSFKPNSMLKVIEWLVPPKCTPLQENIDFKIVASLSLQGESFVYTVNQKIVFLSCLGTPLNSTEEKLLCLELMAGEEQTLSVSYGVSVNEFIGQSIPG